MKTLARPSDKTEILLRLANLRPESARSWGRMTAHQMVCHLADSLRMAAGQKPATYGRVPIPRAIVKWVALYLPLRWPPGRIRTSPELDQELGGTPPSDFGADLAEVAGLLDLVTAPAGGLRERPHPVFGRMSDAAWLRWGYLHLDHHLRQFGV
jgi:hypothetical protein